MKLAITVNLTNMDGTAAIETTTIEVEIPDFEDFSGPERFGETFDTYERTVLKARNEAIEAATEKYLSELVKKKASARLTSDEPGS